MPKKYIITCILTFIFLSLVIVFLIINSENKKKYYLICKEASKSSVTLVVDEKKKDIWDERNSVSTIDLWDDYLIIFTLDNVNTKGTGIKSKYTINRISGEINGHAVPYDYTNNKLLFNHVESIEGICEKTYKKRL